MVTVNAAPFGLQPRRNRRSSSETYQANRYKIKAGYATKMAVGDLVATGTAGNLGYVVLYAQGGASILGVFGGIVAPYFDQNINGPAFPAGGQWPGSGANAASDVDCLVYDDPDMTFVGQAVGGTWVQSWRGKNIDIVAGTPGVPGAAGYSSMSLDGASVATTNTFPLRIQEIILQPGGIGVGAGLAQSEGGGGSDVSITNPWIEVTLNFGLSETQQALGI